LTTTPFPQRAKSTPMTDDGRRTTVWQPASSVRRLPSVVCRLLFDLGPLLFALCPSPPAHALQPEPPAPVAVPPLAAQWEAVLLPEAIRYLRLSPAQLRQLLPLARTAEDRLAKLAAEETKRLAALDRIARENRQALLAGRAASPRDEADAL